MATAAWPTECARWWRMDWFAALILAARGGRTLIRLRCWRTQKNNYDRGAINLRAPGLIRAMPLRNRLTLATASHRCRIQEERSINARNRKKRMATSRLVNCIIHQTNLSPRCMSPECSIILRCRIYNWGDVILV